MQHMLIIRMNAGAVIVATSLLVAFILSAPYGVDSFYHIKYSQLLWKGEHAPFYWLPFTIYADHYPDHHYGFHLFLAALCQFDDILSNARFVLFLQLSILHLTVAYLVGKYANRQMGLWIVMIILLFWGMSAIANLRFFMVRAHVIGCCLVLLYTHFVLTRKVYGVLLLSFLVSFYFYLIWFYCLLFLLLWLILGFGDRRSKLQIVAMTILGGFIGIFLHPEFPATLGHIYFYLHQKTFQASHIPVGGEWYPLTLGAYITQTAFSIVFLYSFLCLLPENSLLQKNKRVIAVWLVFWIAMSFASARHLEYYLPILFVYGISPILSYMDALPQKQKRGSYVTMLFLSIFLFGYTIHETRGVITKQAHYNQFLALGRAAEWMKDNSEIGDLVINVRWSDFSLLYPSNTKNAYAWGLEPKYLFFQIQICTQPSGIAPMEGSPGAS